MPRKKVKKEIKKINCKTCGKEFLPRNKVNIFCSNKCRDKDHNSKFYKEKKEEKIKIDNSPQKCVNCGKSFPKSTLTKTGHCVKCESVKKTCKFCGKVFFPKNPKREFCQLRCSALFNQKLATEAGSGPRHDLQDILDDLVPLLQYDCPLEEACLHTGRSYSTVKNYLYGGRDLDKNPEIAEFRRLIKKATQYVKVAARRTLVESIALKNDVNSAKYVISNRDKRYQGGVDENGEGAKKTVIYQMAMGPSPFIQPTDNLGKENTEPTEDDIEVD